MVVFVPHTEAHTLKISQCHQGLCECWKWCYLASAAAVCWWWHTQYKWNSRVWVRERQASEKEFQVKKDENEMEWQKQMCMFSLLFFATHTRFQRFQTIEREAEGVRVCVPLSCVAEIYKYWYYIFIEKCRQSSKTEQYHLLLKWHAKSVQRKNTKKIPTDSTMKRTNKYMKCECEYVCVLCITCTYFQINIWRKC